MNITKLRKIWIHEQKIGMKGWNFSHLDGRWFNEKLPWDYRTLVLKYLHDHDMLLDMGTGGGELLSSFHHLDSLTAVTEAWQPNIELLQQTLQPRGVKVYPVTNADELTVEDGSIDIMTNSHDAFNPMTVFNKLKPKGLFITEQVGATNNFSLSQFLLPDYQPAFPENTLLNTMNGFQQAGFNILLEQQAFSEMKFFDVGAIVYYASIIPWEFPNFDVNHCFSKLLDLQRMINCQGSVSTHEDRFVMIAQRP